MATLCAVFPQARHLHPCSIPTLRYQHERPAVSILQNVYRNNHGVRMHRYQHVMHPCVCVRMRPEDCFQNTSVCPRHHTLSIGIILVVISIISHASSISCTQSWKRCV
jgi:hypothetical protein